MPFSILHSRVLFLFVGVLSALLIIKCVNLNLLDSSFTIKNVDNTVFHQNTSGPIHPTSQPETVSPKSYVQSGYVVPLGYGGHQGRGATGIASLQCFIKSFDLPMHIVEPLVSASQFLGLPKGKWVKFNDMFDINHFNKLTQVEDRFAQIVTWDDFYKMPLEMLFL